jgi:hypothetical protein
MSLYFMFCVPCIMDQDVDKYQHLVGIYPHLCPYMLCGSVAAMRGGGGGGGYF